MPILHLLPVPISDNSLNELPEATKLCVASLDTFIVERAKTARHWLKEFGQTATLNSKLLIELPKHDEVSNHWFIENVPNTDIGLMSEAGSPCIADPGNAIVTIARELGWRIQPHVGPVSLMLALMASGLNGQNFQFHGYLPQKKEALKQAIRQIEIDVNKTGSSHIFIETPYRNLSLLETLLSFLDGSIRLHISIDLTGENEFAMTKTVNQWKKSIPEAIGLKMPAIFILGK